MRAIRHFKPDPVPDDVVRQLLDAAIRAPSSGNSQPWNWVVVKDPDLRRQIADYYRRAFEAGYGASAARDPRPERRRILDSATHLAGHMGEAPVLVLACMRQSGPGGLVSGSSIYPAVQNFMLAARAFGLGTVVTTIHLAYDNEVKALLGIPDDVAVAALIPLGYPSDATQFGPTTRRPVEEVAFLDGWGTPLQ